MKHLSILLRYELHQLFVAPATYVAAVLFVVSMGVIYLFSLLSFSQAPREGLPSLLFFGAFWGPALFAAPLLTMKSIAEERRLGTLEALLATPASPVAIVLGKFLSTYIFYLILWGLTLTFPFIVKLGLNHIAVDERLTDLSSLVGGYGFVAISGLLFIAFGIFASSLTRSQLVAGMLTFSGLFLIVASCRLMQELPLMEMYWLSSAEPLVEYFQAFDHLKDFSRGIIDTRPFAYYLSSSAVLLILTMLNIATKE